MYDGEESLVAAFRFPLSAFRLPFPFPVSRFRRPKPFAFCHFHCFTPKPSSSLAPSLPRSFPLLVAPLGSEIRMTKIESD